MSNIAWVYLDAFIYSVIAVCPFFFLKKRGNNIYYNGEKYEPIAPIIFSLLILYCVFDHTGGDYFHYKSIIQEVRSTRFHASHLEYPYIILSRSIIGDIYPLWRLCIWGTALLVYRQLLIYLNLPLYKSYWIYSLISLIPFASGRVSLAIVVCLWGIYLLQKQNLCKKIIGIVLLIVSIFLHKSIFIIILAYIIAFIPFTTFTIIAILCSIPIAVYIINKYLYEVLLIASYDDSAVTYFSSQRDIIGNGELIYIVLIWVPIIYFLFYYRAEFLSTQFRFIKRTYKLVIILLLFSITLYSLDLGSIAIPNRVRNMCYIPISLLFAYKYRKSNLCKKDLTILISLLLGNLYQLSYLLYLKKIGLGI